LNRLRGGIADVEAALPTADAFATRLGRAAVVQAIARSATAMDAMIHFPNAQNPLYGGRDQFLPTDFPQPENNYEQQTRSPWHPRNARFEGHPRSHGR